MFRNRDRRPKRPKKPGLILITVLIVVTPLWVAVPFVGWLIAALGWIDLAHRYYRASQAQLVPYGTFRGEN